MSRAAAARFQLGPMMRAVEGVFCALTLKEPATFGDIFEDIGR